MAIKLYKKNTTTNEETLLGNNAVSHSDKDYIDDEGSKTLSSGEVFVFKDE